MTWIVTDRKSNTIYIDLNSEDGKALYLAPGQEPRMVAKEERVLHASPHILPFKYSPSPSEAEGFTRLKALLMDTIPAEDHQRYFIMCWLISIFLMDYFRDRGILQLVGGPAVGKSVTLDRAAMLIYGQSFWGLGTDEAHLNLSSVVPLLFLDNMENRNIGLQLGDFLLFMAHNSIVKVGSSDKGIRTYKPNAGVMISSVEPLSEREPELINRTFPVEFNRILKQPAFLNDQTMKLIKEYRNQMLSDIFRLISLKVLPRLDRRDAWRSIISTRYAGHNKERLNDHLAVIALVLESMLEYLPVLSESKPELQALALIDQWIAYWDGPDRSNNV